MHAEEVNMKGRQVDMVDSRLPLVYTIIGYYRYPYDESVLMSYSRDDLLEFLETLRLLADVGIRLWP
jgi:hypothetical protein